VQIGRSQHWTYDAGDWKETKITPDLWEVSYAVTKMKGLKFKLAHKSGDRGKVERFRSDTERHDGGHPV
jgi:hypothetical protein